MPVLPLLAGQLAAGRKEDDFARQRPVKGRSEGRKKITEWRGETDLTEVTEAFGRRRSKRCCGASKERAKAPLG
jgi:hypothetical protein